MPYDGVDFEAAEARRILLAAADLIEKHGASWGCPRRGEARCVMQAIADLGGGGDWDRIRDWSPSARLAAEILARYVGVPPRRLFIWHDNFIFFRRRRVVSALRRADRS